MIADSQPYIRRAQFLWPRLDMAQLRRTGGEPSRIARVVARRTTLPPEAITEMLRRADDLRGTSP